MIATAITTYNYIKFSRSLKYGTCYIVLPLYHVGSTEDIEVFEEIEEDDFSMWEEESETLQADSQVVWLVYLIGCLQRKHYIPDSAISFLLQIIYIQERKIILTK